MTRRRPIRSGSPHDDRSIRADARAGGGGAAASAWVPAYTDRRPLSLPVVLVALGALLFLAPFGFTAPRPAASTSPSPSGSPVRRTHHAHGRRAEDRPTLRPADVEHHVADAGGRDADHDRVDRVPRRVRRWSAGDRRAAARCRARTDRPHCLTADVQVGEPTLDQPLAPRAEEEVRFTLASEGGLNDALAFPFVYARAPRGRPRMAARWVVRGVASSGTSSGGSPSVPWSGTSSGGCSGSCRSARRAGSAHWRIDPGVRRRGRDVARLRHRRAAAGLRLPRGVRRHGRAPGGRATQRDSTRRCTPSSNSWRT